MRLWGNEDIATWCNETPFDSLVVQYIATTSLTLYGLTSVPLEHFPTTLKYLKIDGWNITHLEVAAEGLQTARSQQQGGCKLPQLPFKQCDHNSFQEPSQSRCLKSLHLAEHDVVLRPPAECVTTTSHQVRSTWRLLSVTRAITVYFASTAIVQSAHSQNICQWVMPASWSPARCKRVAINLEEWSAGQLCVNSPEWIGALQPHSNDGK